MTVIGLYLLVGLAHANSAFTVTGESIIRKCLKIVGMSQALHIHMACMVFTARHVPLWFTGPVPDELSGVWPWSCSLSLL